MRQQKSPNVGLVLMITLAISATSCAGKRASKEETAGAQVSGKQVDMTRPPRTIGAEREIVVEGNPDETISFEEWKRRQEQAAAEQGPDQPEE